MFERYTEKARRVVFFGRYEASQVGSPHIETEHLLLGLLREDKALTNRFLCSAASVESIRKQIEEHTTLREKISTRIDIPLSNECKRVLAYAAEEAERLSHKHIGTEHLLLGLLREDKCFAARILHECGLRLSNIREELAPSSHEQAQPQLQWASMARRHYWIGTAVQLALVTLLGIVVAKSTVSGRRLLVIGAIWFLATFAWRVLGPSSLWMFGKRNRATAIGISYLFLSLYHLFMFGWLIPFGVGIYRVTMR